MGDTTGIGSLLRSLRGDLQDVTDDKLAQVVAVLDGLANRGDADALIAPLRPRLARLRLPRPLNFRRVLFNPFDPLIVSTPHSIDCSPALPRSVLRPLANLVREKHPAMVRAFDARIIKPPADAYAQREPVGKTIWATAGDILLAADRPADWQHSSGLRNADFDPICKSVGTILILAAKLHDMAAANLMGFPPDTSSIEGLLSMLNTADTRTVSMLIVLLNASMPNAAAVRALNQTLGHTDCPPTLRLAADQAQGFILGALEKRPSLSSNLIRATIDIENAADTLDAQAARLRGRPAEQDRLTATRLRLDRECRAQFGNFMTKHVFEPLDQIANADDTTIDGFERDALALRRFEQAARRIGGAASYDIALRASMEKFRPRRSDSIATRIDRLRLAEILLGSQAAVEIS